MLVAAMVLTLAALPGITRLGFDTEVRDIFRSADQQYAAYEDALRLFPGIESGVIVLLPGRMADTATLNALLAIERELNGMPGVERVVSLVSLPAVEQILLDPFDLSLPERVSAEQAESIRQLVESGAPGAQTLIGGDGELQVLLVQLSPGRDAPGVYGALRPSIVSIFERALSPYGMDFLMAGVPEMELAIREEALRDTTRIVAVAATLCSLVAWFLFRSLAILLTLGFGPALGVVWTLGVMGHAGSNMTVFTTILVPLLFVIGYTNAAHVVFAVSRAGGSPGWRRSGRALGSVLRACLVSAVTTAIGFISLSLSSSPLVSGFGLYSALGTLLTFLAVVLSTPALSVLLGIGNHPINPGKVWAGMLARLGGYVTSRPMTNLVLATLLIPLAVWLALQLEADYRFRENFPPESGFHRAIALGDQQLSGLVTAHVLVRWSADDAPDLETLLAAEGRILEAADGFSSPQRTLALSTLLPADARVGTMTPRDLEAILPPGMLEGLLNVESGAALLTLPMRDAGARQHAPALAEFERRLDRISADFPGLSLSLTGLGPAAVKGSGANILEMARSLALALVAIFLVIALVLRSLRLGLVCMVPNVLPLVGVAALMSLASIPLQFNTVLVFTICIGIAVDDTVHLVFRYRSLLANRDSDTAIRQALSQVGLVLVFTSLVLGTGFLSLMASAIPVVELMGLLGAVALALALVADLVLLPSLLSRFDGHGVDD